VSIIQQHSSVLLSVLLKTLHKILVEYLLFILHLDIFCYTLIFGNYSDVIYVNM